jgi:hypothetical protein
MVFSGCLREQRDDPTGFFTSPPWPNGAITQNRNSLSGYNPW